MLKLNKKSEDVVITEKNINGISKGWNIVMNIILAIFSFMCIFPFIFVVIISFTDEKTLARNGYRIIPQKFSLAAYEYIFKSGRQLLNSYIVTIAVTILGTLISLLVISMFSYALSRKNFRYRKLFAFMAFFTMLFNGGLVPTYMVCSRLLHLNDTIWALILPMCVNAFYILVLRTFFQTSVPDSIIESAKIDGASEFRTFLQIVLPISLPGLATIGLFCTLGYWNDWFNALLYIENPSFTPLQYMLMKIENSIEFISQNSGKINTAQSVEILANLPKETSKMAMVVLATGPIVLAYPFFQKYFVSGLTVGAIKE